MNNSVNKEEKKVSRKKNINQEKIFTAHILNIIAFIIPIVLIIAVYNMPYDDNKNDNGGVNVTMQTELPFKTFIAIMAIGVCIFIVGLYLYFTKINKFKHMLAYVYLFASIIDLIWLFITTCLYVIATCGLGAVMFMLTDYALEKGFKIVKVYSDDDESGLYDDRPGFEEMILDAKMGEYDVIIAKSQSRFSRNMEHIEKYLHHMLPNLGIRFIGVVDGVDTDNEGNKKSRQINGLVNEWYCEDLSKNIRSAFKAKMKDGQFLGSSCPYGYIRDPKNHNHLIIDNYAAKVVQRIYDLYICGYGKAKIGSILSCEGILIPSIYKREVLHENYHNACELETTSTWSYQTIATILNNEVYIGHLIQNKANTLSYKDKRKVLLPKDKWIKVENTHEAIIDVDTYNRVQELQKVRRREVKDTEPNGIFSGLIFCADCGHAMARKYARRGQKGFIGYICKIYKTMGKSFCVSHSINVDELEEAVLLSIKEEARKILKPDDIDTLTKMSICDRNSSFYQQQIEELNKRLDKISVYKKKTYDNYMEEIISKEEYLKYVRDYDVERKKIESEKEEVLDKIESQKELDNEYDEWVEAFKDYINIEELTRDIIVELIEKIEVNADGSINIHYRFNNPYSV